MDISVYFIKLRLQEMNSVEVPVLYLTFAIAPTETIA